MNRCLSSVSGVSSRGLWLTLALLGVGCGAPRVSMRAMSAAAVNIPAEIQTVAVVDRSSAKNAGETALGILEGVVTGEAPLEDNEGRRLAVSSLVATLESAPRFEVIRPTLSPKEVESSLMDKRWNHEAVSKLCEKHGCDAVIALETFDSDAQVASGLIEGAITAATSSSSTESSSVSSSNSGSSSRESASEESSSSGGAQRGGAPSGGASRADLAAPEAGDKVSSAEAPTATAGGQQRSSTSTTGTSGGGSRGGDGGTAPVTERDSGDTGSSTPTETDSPPDASPTDPPPMTHWARRTTRLNATWRMYSAREDVILDEDKDHVMGSQSRAEGTSAAEALANLTTASAMISADGRKLGNEYATRISPTWINLSRPYFASGPLKMGKRYVLAGDWEGAVAFWRTVIDDPESSPKVRGKARHNLAVAAERQGRLKMAVKLAQKAAVESNSRVSQQYAQSLLRRVEEQRRVAEQLAAPEIEE